MNTKGVAMNTKHTAISWDYLVSQVSHGKSVRVSRYGNIYSLPQNIPIRDGSYIIELVRCSGHDIDKFLPCAEEFDDIFRCSDCCTLTAARNPIIDFKYSEPLFKVELQEGYND